MQKKTIRSRLGTQYAVKADKVMQASNDYKKIKQIIDRYNTATGRTKSYKVHNANTSGVSVDTQYARTTSKISQ